MSTTFPTGVCQSLLQKDNRMDDEIIALAGIRPGQPAKKRRAAAAAPLRMSLFFATSYVNGKS
jgi:hypothetical protein